jgi:hypothetical protein
VIQIIPRVNTFGLYGGGSQFFSVHSGLSQTSQSHTMGPDSAKHPWSVAGTFRHLVVTVNVPHPTLTVTLLVNGAPTALAATLDTTATRAMDTGATVAVAAGDDVCYQITGATQLYPGLAHHATCVEFEGAASSYGVAAYATGGTPVAVGTALIGGALGNGEWSGFGGQPQSNTYSICAVPGTLTRLDLTTYAGAPGAGGWVGQVRTNGVTQDGTAGTVNTTCTLTGAVTRAVATFSLPLALTDLVDVVVTRTGVDAPAGPLVQVAASVAFTPSTPDVFMLCGGSNDALNSAGPDWKWTHNGQLVASEALGQAPIGPAGVHAQGLYVVRSGPPAPGHQTVYTLRRSGADTPLTVTVADLATTGRVTADVDLANGESVTLQAVDSAGAVGGGLHWGVAASAAPAPPVSYTVDERTIRRLRRAPHVAQDNRRTFVKTFELDLERGQGLATGQGSAPVVLLRVSRDGGQTWGEEVRMVAPRLGDYTARVKAERLGQGRDLVFEVVVSDPINWSLVNAWLDVEGGTS